MPIDHDPTSSIIDFGDNSRHAVDSIIEAARAGRPVELLELGNVYTRQRADGGVEVIDLTGEEHRIAASILRQNRGEAPVSRMGEVVLTEPDSFITYVNDHGDPERSSVVADRDAGRLVAVLDGHNRKTGEAGWGAHQAVLALRYTPSWTTWTQASGILGEQDVFAAFLEDHALDVVEPDAATLLEVATTMVSTTSVAWKSGLRLQDGTVQLAYEETADTKAGTRGDMEIPSTITLGLAPFEGYDPYKVTARLRWRMRDGQLRIGIVLDQIEDILRQAFGGLTNHVAESIGDIPVLHGSTKQLGAL